MAKHKSSPTPKNKAVQGTAIHPTGKQKTNWMPALLLGLLAFLLYANTLSHGYALDDYSVIKDNYVTKQGLEGIPTLMKTNYRYGYWNSEGTLYRPLSLVMFALEWEISPDNPALSHFVNVLLYALTAMLLFFTLSRIFSSYNMLLPFLAIALFVTHPVHTEVVANIKSRDEILTFLFCIGTLYFLWDYLKGNKITQLLLALFSFTLAMFSKENAITFLAVIPLLIFCFTAKTTKENLQTSTWFVLPVILYFIVRQSILGAVMEGANEASLLDNLLMATDNKVNQIATAFVLLGKYLLAILLPITLVSEYGYPQLNIVGWSDWRALLSLLVWLGLGVWALMNVRKHKIPAFGILFFIITFSVFANIIILIGSSYGERFLYMPSLGFAIAITWGLMKIGTVEMEASKVNVLSQFKNSSPLAIASVVIVLLFSVRTVLRNPAWENSFTLYHADIPNVPNSAKLNYHYGLEQVKQGLKLNDGPEKQSWIQKGMASFEKAISLYPNYHDAYGELGLGHFRSGQLDKAMENYEKSIQYKPNNAKVYSNMGIIYFQKGQLDKAQEVYEKAVKIDPRFVDARRNLGSVFAQQKRFDEAIVHFTEALKYDPYNVTLHQYMGFVYRDKGDAVNSKIWLDKADALGKNNAIAK